MPRKRSLSLALAAAVTAIGAIQLSGTAQASPTATSGDGAALAVTPPMGWNDWAQYQQGDGGDVNDSFNEKTVEANAKALVNSGLAVKGYNTVTVDDNWMRPSRDANGNLVTNSALFPDGMAALGTYLHGLGLKFGIYEDAGYATCLGNAGSGIPNGGGADHFAQDAKLFASWGVDYLKLDGCNVYVPSGETQLQAYQNAYAAENSALKASGRDIVFSESAPAYFQGGTENGTPDWYSVLGWTGQYGQLWREGWDVATYDASKPANDRFYSVLNNYGYNRWLTRYAGPGDWNDPDFLIPGEDMTTAETRSQISLWAMMSAPMILSTDLTTLDSQSTTDIGNAAVIAIDQDSLGKQATVESTNGSADVLAKPLSNGDRAVALLNRGSSTATVSTSTSAIGLTGGAGCTYTLKDEWSGTTTSTTGAISASLAAHATALYRVTPSAGCGTVVPTGEIEGDASNCADDSGSGTADGNPIVLYPCTGNANQRWAVGSDGTIRTEGKCLSAQNGGTANGTWVVLSTCSGAAGQTWSYKSNGNLVDTHSGLCLDVYGGGTQAGTKLDIWPCGDNQLNQVWDAPQH